MNVFERVLFAVIIVLMLIGPASYGLFAIGEQPEAPAVSAVDALGLGALEALGLNK